MQTYPRLEAAIRRATQRAAMARVKTQDIPRDQRVHFGRTVRQVPLFHAVGDVELDELLDKMQVCCVN